MSQESTASQENPTEVLRSLILGHFRFQFLSAAFQFGLFSILSREPGLTRAEVARRLEIAEYPARILLFGCVSTGLVRKDGDRFFLTPVSEPLTKNPEEVPGAQVAWQQHINYRPMAWFFESLKENTNIGLQRAIPGDAPDLYARLAGDPQLETVFHNMMGSVSRLVSAELVDKLDLSKYNHILDIAGGTAINATAFARRWPHLRITICDLPTVAERANARVAELGLADRVRAVELDAFADEYPKGADCVFFGHFLEIWSPEQVQTLLGKAARALEPGGSVISTALVANDEETGPVNAAALSAYMLTIASGHGFCYTCAEYEEWLTEAGFEPGERVYVGPLGDAAVFGVKK
jgi:ubiquinone/menaquinone biosynthesis C-methylase UbiE